MSSLHGDAAVARLDAAVDAFLDIMTAPENTLVPVPERSPQPSLAERARVNLKPSTDLAKGYADEARRSAQEAAQITGLETVADAIGLAALPLPDVWAPLSDSLRLITGYGRDVLVGSDVVARFVGFSRSTTRTYTAKDGTLKTAAINEPCFEKEGLHLDVQSTNLVPKSEDLLTWAKNGAITVEKQPGVYTKITPAMGTSGCYLSVITLVVGRVYTISFWGYADAEVSTNIGIEREPSGRVAKLTTTPTRFSRTFTASQASGTIVAYSYFKDGPTTNFYVGGFQLEELPFASSYIPTNGAAATRAADLLQFVGPGNHPDILSGVPFTLAMRMSCEEAATGAMRDLVLCPALSYSLLRRATNTIRYYRDGTGQLSVNAPARTVNVVAVRVSAGNVCTLRVGSTQASRTEVPLSGGKVSTINITNVAGHVRDFRIWQQALTDEQFKAIP